MRRIYVTPSGSPFEVVRADITQVVQGALPRATGGVLSLTVEQAPADSSGGYGWWIAYAANSLPERTVVVYDGGHTDTQSGNGAFAFEGFAVGPAPVTARVHLHGGGDSVGDAPSTGRFVTSRGVVTLNDITDPAAGNYAGTQNVDVASVLAPGDVRAAMDFGLRNYSGLGFAALEVNAPPVEACTPACASGEVCVGGQCRPGLGCGFGPRVGFTNTAAYPNVAACGCAADVGGGVALGRDALRAGLAVVHPRRPQPCGGPHARPRGPAGVGQLRRRGHRSLRRLHRARLRWRDARRGQPPRHGSLHPERNLPRRLAPRRHAVVVVALAPDERRVRRAHLPQLRVRGRLRRPGARRGPLLPHALTAAPRRLTPPGWRA
jgi:hypothetical protein